MFKSDFPIFKNQPNLVYLDSAATSQKPQVVIDAVTSFYTQTNANVHRGIYDLSQQATDAYEGARGKVARLIGAKSEEIVFTANASAGINYIAYGWARKYLQKDDVIVLSEMEHHSNIVPWIRLKDELGVQLVFLPITKDFRLDYRSLISSLRGQAQRETKQSHNTYGLPRFARNDAVLDPRKIKLVALTQVSNVLGTINPIAEIISSYKAAGIEAKFLVDGAQSVPHLAIDVQQLDADFLVFSSHKMLGPSGVGVLWGKKKLLAEMDPFLVGSHMIKTVSKNTAMWQDAPQKFETGTGALEGVVGLGAAIDYLQSAGMEKIAVAEKEVTKYALERLSAIYGLRLFGPNEARDRLSVFSFAIGDIHPHDTAEILNRSHIAIRSGHHCAQLLMKCLGVTGTARASFYLYNTKEDVDTLVEGIDEVKKVFTV